MAVKKEKIVAQAEKLVSKGKVEAAIKEYQKIVEDNPNDTNVLNRIGDLYTRINKIKDAIKVFQQIADHFAGEGFFLRAIAILKKINKLDPSILEVYEQLGDLYIKQNMPRDAASHFQYLADYYIRQDNHDKALDIYKRIVDMDQDNIAARGKLAELYQNAGMKEKATREYQGIGAMLAKQGHFQEAVKVYQQAIKLDPSNVDLAKELADTLTNQGKVDEAMSILKMAAEAKPDDPEIIRILLKAYEKTGNHAEALQTIQNALRNAPEDISLHEMKASFLLKLNKTDEAAEATIFAAELALGMKDVSKAMNLLQTILKREAHNVPALEKLLEIYEDQHQDTYVVFTMSQLIEAFLTLNLFDKAEEMAQRLIDKEPDNAQHREKLVYIQDRMGKAPAMEDISMEPSTELKPEDLEELPEIQIPELVEEQELEPTAAVEAVEDLPSDVSEFVSERMVEVDVFLKYGLLDRAVEQLDEIISRAPSHAPAYAKLV